MKPYRWIFTASTFLALGALVLFFSQGLNDRKSFGGIQLRNNQHVDEPSVTHYSYFNNKDLYERLYEQSGDILAEQKKVYGVILPHHLIVGDRIAGMYERLREQKMKTVVVVGPNHFNAGHGDIITSRAIWETPYGTIKPDNEMINSLQQGGMISVEESPFEQEHSITAHVAFIKRTWPDARIVPLIVKWGTSREEVERIAKIITNDLVSSQKHNSPQPSLTLREGVLMIASVDFSHHQPWWVADFHDERSMSVIESFDQDRVKDLEIDSPASIQMLMKFLALQNAKTAIRVDHTNTVKLTGNLESTENTTHVFEYFVSGEVVGERVVSLLLFPDMMLGRTVASVSMKNGGYEYPFENLKGVEGLFFRGFDMLVANLEGPITEYRAPNQKSISFAFDPRVANVLTKYRFDALSLANNHGNDQDSRGFEDTKRFLSEQGIEYFGNPVKEGERESVLIQTIGGRRIGFVGFNLTDHVVDNKQLQEIVASTKLQSDFVVVFPHWGAEYQRYPTSSQKTWAHLFIDAGADAVIGHHPHVVETMEVYKGKPVFYSLGNFIFDQYFSKETQEGLGLGIVVRDSRVNYYLMPYTIPKSQPTLMLHADRETFLKQLIIDSKLDIDVAHEVELGVMTASR